MTRPTWWSVCSRKAAYFHLAGVQASLIRGEAVPGGHPLGRGDSSVPGGTMPISSWRAKTSSRQRSSPGRTGRGTCRSIRARRRAGMVGAEAVVEKERLQGRRWRSVTNSMARSARSHSVVALVGGGRRLDVVVVFEPGWAPTGWSCRPGSRSTLEATRERPAGLGSARGVLAG